MNNFIKSIQLLALGLLTVFAETTSAQSVFPEQCNSSEVKGNEVIFHCENQIDVQFKLIDEGIFRIWYDQNGFSRNNPSFAVIKEPEKIAVNITEMTNRYEIYTGDLIVRVYKSPFSIKIFDKYQKLIMSDYQDKGFETDSTYIISRKVLKPGEKIYGLGEKNGPLNRVGSTFKMWNSDKPCYGLNEDPLYKSIPFFMSSSGYGLYFDNTFKTVFDFGVENKESYSFSAPGGEMLYYFIYGPEYREIISKYTDLTGQPIMPPDWAMGFSQCRGLLTSEDLTRKIAEGYRQRQIPCDIIYQDIGWTQYLQDFEWHDEKYENPQKMVSDLASDGFKVIVSQDPVISQANQKQWTEADSLGFFAKDIRTGKSYDMPWPWGGNCGVVDFTNPEVADWWGTYQQKVLDDGVRGFWTDMGEPAWSNEEDTDRLFMKHHLGMHEEIHNVYGHTWDKVVTEQFEKRNPNQRIFQMTRSAFAGMQRYTFGWSGDAGNGREVTEGWKKLKAQIPLALSAGMGGIPFWSCDISGYCGDIEDYEEMSELYVRWLQFGVFNPLSRAHHEGNNAVEPWLFGDEATEINKKAIELKYTLFPYIYTYAREAHDTGMPLMRALFLEYPFDKEVENLDTQFFFGKELLVAPVVEEAAATKRVYFPEGIWIDYQNPENQYEGGQWKEIPVKLETIPLFVKKGTIIPTMPVMQYIGQNPDYPLILKVFPPEIYNEAKFMVYEDDGDNNDYKQGSFANRNIKVFTKDNAIEIEYNDTVYQRFSAVERDLYYDVKLEKKPRRITFGKENIKKTRNNLQPGERIEKVKWYWDKSKQMCRIYIPKEMENHKKLKIIF